MRNPPPIPPEIAELWGNRGETSWRSIDSTVPQAWECLKTRFVRHSGGWLFLSSSLKGGPPSIGTALPLVRIIADALAGLHTTGVVIRELRPETTLVHFEEWRVQFLDMGVAALPESLIAGLSRSAEDVVTDSIRGASPEQVMGKRLDHRSNLFSLGCLAYEILTGVAPFRGPTALETASRVLVLEPSPACRMREGIPKALDDLIQMLLQKDPERRPASAAAVAMALGAIEKGEANPLKIFAEENDLEARIEALYSRIDTLSQEKRQGIRREEGDLAEAVRQLRELQKVEAARFRQEFEGSLAMPMDAGRRILERSRNLRKKLERSAAANPAST